MAKARSRAKKTEDQTESLPADPTPPVEVTIQPSEIVHGIGESTRSEPESYAPPVTASGGPGTVRATGSNFTDQHAPAERTHTEAVGKRGPRYNDQGISDKLAGAKLLEHHDPFFSIIRFEEKPSDAVREMLREAEFRWHPENKEWNRPIRFETRQQDRIDAERVFEDVCATIRAERGINHTFG